MSMTPSDFSIVATVSATPATSDLGHWMQPVCHA